MTIQKYAEGGFTSPISRTGLNTGNAATNPIVTLSDQQVAHPFETSGTLM